MSITPSAIDPRRAAPPLQQLDPAEKQRKRVYMGFAASVGLVLALAVSYVGVRVFAAQGAQSVKAVTSKVAPAPKVPLAPKVAPAVRVASAANIVPPVKVAAVAVPTPILTPPPVVKVSELPKAQPQSIPAPISDKPIATQTPTRTWTAVTPHAGETYLQVIALGGRFVESYVNDLKAKGLHPVVAMSPLDDIYRILFGPFKDRQARDLERKDLEAAGLQPMAQIY
jgi:hypothetical protein